MCTQESHAAIKRSRDAWLALPVDRGYQDAFDGRGTKLWMKNCSACGSTLCLTVRRAREVTL